MKYNMNQPIKNYKGEEIQMGKETNLVKDIAIRGLMVMTEKDKNMSGEEKYQRYKLASKIDVEGEAELSVEEVSMLKKQIGLVYNPIVVGSMYDFLEKGE